MERIISDEEKIRRAIEISKRRNGEYYSNDTKTARVNISDKKNYILFRKMIFQIIICLLIYAIFYLISTTNYVFSNQVIDTTTAILNYDINFEKIYNDCKEFINSKINTNQNNNIKEILNETKEEIEEETNEETNKETNSENDQNTVISKAVEDKNSLIQLEQLVVKNEEKEVEIKETDAQKVKKICEIKRPLKGKITSEFGEREVTAKVMSADHKGIDIAANSGTTIVSAMNGTVTVASKNSEYGKFIKIEYEEVMTVYAHCKDLKVKEGDKVKIGQKIATVGSTGNSTGPHLHFEIRLSGRYINPRDVIEF